MKLTDYLIVTARTYLELQTLIDQRLKEGWKLTGGVCTWANGFMQAIYDNPANKKSAKGKVNDTNGKKDN